MCTNPASFMVFGFEKEQRDTECTYYELIK